jgi:hypothetical protein
MMMPLIITAEPMELSDTLAIIPKAILSKVFGIPEDSLKDIPMQTVTITGGEHP